MLKSETIGDKELQKQRVRERYNERADPDKMFVIPATEQPINIYEDDQQRRVAVYVRVSTDSVQQTSSYELQKNYYTSFVESHPNWVLVHIYADEERSYPGLFEMKTPGSSSLPRVGVLSLERSYTS